MKQPADVSNEDPPPLFILSIIFLALDFKSSTISQYRIKHSKNVLKIINNLV